MEKKRMDVWKEEIEVLSLTIDIPEEKGERKSWFYSYEDVLTKLVNNKREDKDILEIENYYGSNKITIRINWTSYLEDNRGDTEEELIEHLKNWLSSGVDVSNDKIKAEINKGCIYTIDGWYNGVKDFDENDKRIYNYSMIE